MSPTEYEAWHRAGRPALGKAAPEPPPPPPAAPVEARLRVIEEGLIAKAFGAEPLALAPTPRGNGLARDAH